ncbi:TPA: DUF1366 domain-containing protein, partial [Streptococcus equi subsp. equi]|nr:DUF1366 domain-containing protein [Streptococcus equi subsp. equi]HEK9213417.1 DUF1366 domain-containing protein [Streptococcus equi subsp. equi]HEK9218574.1 DUF1366 domain-containing protein [Streptococcus equi subsp. equi]HEK9231970.1 DUF1366 domain-containing protein [Streptococcus equi subsp. equi]HEK9778195.1 DUF1366 domain-containing protein [Streptococcus equi subsp. equi]
MARNWKIVGKYPQPNALGVIEGTHVIITGDDGASIPQTIKKDLSSTNDLDVIKMVLDEFKKSEYVEIAMGEAVQKVDDLEKLSQDTAKTATTAQTAAGLARAAAERTQKMINLQTIHVLTSGGKIEPDIYKGMLELIEPAKKGQYQEHDVFTVLDDKHEDLAGEGKLVFV